MKNQTLSSSKQKALKEQKLKKLYQKILKAQKSMVMPIWSVQLDKSYGNS